MHSSVSLLELGPLPLVLGFACSQQQPLRTACNLMATCKGMQAAVRSHSGGLVPVAFTAHTLQRAAVLAAWLAKNGSIVSSLEFKTQVEHQRNANLMADPQRSEAEAAIAAALQRAAAASTGGLQLQHCKLHRVGAGCAAILQQLPGSCLTSLDLTFKHCVGNATEPSVYLSSVAQALPNLTQLQSLELVVEWYTAATGVWGPLSTDALLKPLSCLTNLTSLVLGQVEDNAEMQHLPPQLLELQCQLDVGHGEFEQLRLNHLTALTKLNTDKYTQMHAECILPPNLLQLYIGDITSARCLLPLTKLERMVLERCTFSTAPAAELQLASLTSLTHVGLSYCDGIDAIDVDGAAGGWSALPLKSLFLEVADGELSHNTVQQLSKLRGLTCLSMSICACTATCMQGFAAVLRCMTSLQELSLDRVQWQQADAVGAAGGAGMKAVAGAIAALPQLQDLNIQEEALGIEAAMVLAAATQLTSLTLRCCDLDDCCLNTIVLGLTGLHSLDVYGNENVTDGVLPVIARVLPWLRVCCLGETGVTAGRRQLFKPALL